jgi:hypothetical protein
MRQRQNTFFHWSIAILVLGLHELIFGLLFISLSAPHTSGYRLGLLLLCCFLPDLLIGACFGFYDRTLNKDYDTRQVDCRAWQEYKRLESLFRGHK